MAILLPPEPHVPDAQRGQGSLTLRYEDVTQDGRMRLELLSHAIGAAVWRGALRRHPILGPRLADAEHGRQDLVSLADERLEEAVARGDALAEERVGERSSTSAVRARDTRPGSRVR